VSRGLNKVLLIGRLGRAPEMRYTPGGTPVTTFALATSRIWVTPEGDRREITEWFNVVAWRRLAELCSQRLAGGSRVYVEGRLQTRSWEDAEGQRHQRVEVVAHEMIFFDAGTREGVESDDDPGDQVSPVVPDDGADGYKDEGENNAIR
jgi:single-strand DNA-binding protein